jgi:hypothetical protein
MRYLLVICAVLLTACGSGFVNAQGESAAFAPEAKECWQQATSAGDWLSLLLGLGTSALGAPMPYVSSADRNERFQSCMASFGYTKAP